MAIELSKDERERSIASIKQYFTEELDQDIGDLKSSLLLDFVLKEIGPVIHNRAVADAQARMQEMVAELDGSCYEPEFAYWKR
ncbi:DUF2164 domain-containing protein [Candidatus Bipolaricaulota bacterium]|nr:DUF2164 domain-containing protein [Candidatus Bipolaricaulota bacterium]